MKASNIDIKELLNFSDGRLDIHGRRLITHDVHAFAQFRRELVELTGHESARRTLFRFGFYWGQADAAAMRRIFEWESVHELLLAGPRMQTLQGVARSRITSVDTDDDGNYTIVYKWYDSVEAEEHLLEYGVSDHSVCWILMGYASGYCSFCLDQDIFFVEEQCMAQGDHLCLGIGKPRHLWGEDVDTFQTVGSTEDIHRNVVTLTQELKEKDELLRLQEEKLRRFEPSQETVFVEVKSKSYASVLETAVRVAPFNTSVLLAGESGTGKEVLARMIHRNSPRSDSPFVAINCASLPETLLEGELFGYKAGAFTGAATDRQGLFEEASGGTLFLDEIGDVPLSVQVKLLRVLQEHEVLRLGENIPRKIDVRVIAATNKKLSKEIADGHFREDLFYRLSVVEIEIPPLRQRPEDIVPLTRHFVSQAGKRLKMPKLAIDSTCIDYLLGYDWPGNVRELENAVEHAAVFCKKSRITPVCLPRKMLSKTVVESVEPVSYSSDLSLEYVEKEHIESVLRRTHGNKSEAARILGISPVTLWRKLSKWKP